MHGARFETTPEIEVGELVTEDNLDASQAVTLAQIAKRAGVHVSTVSRSLGNAPTGVSSANAARIRAIAESMGYHPDAAASALRTGRSRMIGMLVPYLTDYVLARIFEGADEATRAAGYHTVVSSTYDDPPQRMAKLEQLLTRRPEGIIIADARLDGDDLVGVLRRKKVPYVLVNRRLRGHPSVTLDDVLGGRLAAEHLLTLGHTEVGVLAGPDYASTCVERTHGFVQRYLIAGIGVTENRVVNSRADVEGGHEAAYSLLAANPEITALFAINDFAAIGAMGAARELGRTPGRDIAIVGFNDIPLAQFLPVPLTSVGSPMFEMGQGAARMLCELVAGHGGEPERLAPTLNARASTLGTSPAVD